MEKIASLVLLEADPIQNIHNTTRIVAVIQEGRLVPTKPKCHQLWRSTGPHDILGDGGPLLQGMSLGKKAHRDPLLSAYPGHGRFEWGDEHRLLAGKFEEAAC